MTYLFHGSAFPNCEGGREGKTKGKKIAAQLMQREFFCKLNPRNDSCHLEKFYASSKSHFAEIVGMHDQLDSHKMRNETFCDPIRGQMLVQDDFDEMGAQEIAAQ